MPALVLSLAVFLGGCQEDDRAARTTASQASELAENRIDLATNSLLDTFGQTGPETLQRAVSSEPKTLSWNPPLTREDGSALSPGQIAGFRIYYRLRHQDSYSIIPINDPSVTSFTLGDFSAGAYEFAITTVDVNGLESQRSDPVTADLI
ncbi:fibronectin type III domain-containing protein [Marinobacter salinexigens]|uniref:fibronectin type III domain-containing protein n=1 Tax=Marinobacter salinexigens TaxID=2919747 RepID=UPI001FEC13C0|nr:fibronectin type III domain-containing protein [Marinobacter salinexigens]